MESNDLRIINLLKSPKSKEKIKKRYTKLNQTKKVVVTSGYFDP